MDSTTRLYHGRTIRVCSTDCIEADIDLGFGSHVHRRVLIEGLDRKAVQERMRSKAKHCLVVLLGGKRLVLQTAEPKVEGMTLCRVFLDEQVYGEPEGMCIPFGMRSEMLEVGTFMSWVGHCGFDIDDVKNVLNGKRQRHGVPAHT